MALFIMIKASDEFNSMHVKFEQFWNALSPMSVSAGGNATVVRDVPENAKVSMTVIDGGSMIVDRELQEQKAPSPMVVTVGGIVMVQRELHPEKA